MNIKEWKAANPEKMREYRKRYNAAHPDRVRESRRKDYHRHKSDRKRSGARGIPDPVKQRARWKAQRARRDGKIVKPVACEVCLRERRLHMHHDDYSKPLVVAFLCVDCHALRHRALEEEKP